jgi:hypothetical protein
VGRTKPPSFSGSRRKNRRVEIPSYLTPEQAAVAQTVIQTGQQMGATRKELLAAIETGLVESNLQNLNYGDADSLGWRQERASIYGTGPTGPNNVRAAARRFFQESGPDGNRGAGMTAGNLAQAIQGSAFPERYDQRRADALRILRDLQGRGGKTKPATIVKIGKLAQRKYGLSVSENAAFDGGATPTSGHAPNSFHYSNSAIDVSGDPRQMMRFDKFVARKYGKSLEELFYDPGVSINDGQITSPIGGHSDHVHVAETTGANAGMLGPLPSGGMAPSPAYGYGPTNNYNTTNAYGQPPLAPRERLQMLRKQRSQRRQRAKQFMAGNASAASASESASKDSSTREYSSDRTATRPVDLGL